MRTDIFCGVVTALAAIVVGVDGVRYEAARQLQEAWIAVGLFTVLATLSGWSFSKLAK